MSSLMQGYNQEPIQTIKAKNREIKCFNTVIDGGNIDHSVVDSFGEEWKKFFQFTEAEIDTLGEMYFDILNEKIINKNTYAMDVGCGTGRWTRYLADKIGFMEAIDPSEALYSADVVLADKPNVRLTRASTDNIPFPDETFDFGMSIGVLHHIPDTQKAMSDCVKKVKIGGYFYTYLYYALDNKGFMFKAILAVVDIIRRVVCKLPMGLKKFVCDLIAIFVYMPVVLFGRALKAIGLNKLGDSMPLHGYHNQTFFIIRNDALDRFGTSLEQRFSRVQIREMMKNAGCEDVVISDGVPYWHAVGRRVR